MSQKKDPCQKQACEIQTCLQAHKYIESRCLDVIREMRRCCEVHGAAGKSVCCSGFRDQKSSDSEHKSSAP